MRFYNSFLSICGLLLIVSGVFLNVRMFTQNAWPTYLFFIFIALGILLILIDIPIRKTNRLIIRNKVIIQLLIVILPLITIYLKTQVVDARAQVVIAPAGFSGPYVVIFGIKGKPKLPREGRDLIIRLPQSGVVVTSTKMQNSSSTVENYISNENESYGKRVYMEHYSTGTMTNSNCNFAIDYEGGYFNASGAISSSDLEMKDLIVKVYDSLCKTIK